MPNNSNRLDPETLAAFLDGNLAGEERDRVMRLIARSDEIFEDVLEASEVVAALRQPGLPSGDAQPAVPSSAERSGQLSEAGRPTPNPVGPIAMRFPATRRATWGRRAIFGGALLAAGLASLIVFSGEPRPDPLAALADINVDERLGQGGVMDWGRARGPDEVLSIRARAFRIGARAADLELAFRTRDSAAIDSLATSIANLAAGYETGSTAASRVRFLARGGGREASGRERRDVASELRSLGAAERWFDLGVWSETARRAVHAGQLQYVAPTGPALQRLDSLLTAFDAMPPSERTGTDGAVARLRAFQASGVAGDSGLKRIAAALDSTVSELGH